MREDFNQKPLIKKLLSAYSYSKHEGFFKEKKSGLTAKAINQWNAENLTNGLRVTKNLVESLL